MSNGIVEKIRVNHYDKKLILNKPEDISEFNDLDFDANVNFKKYDLIFSFVFSLESFKEEIYNVIKNDLLNEKGYVFLVYPKKGNKKYINYIHRDDILPYVEINEEGYVGNSDLKFSRMLRFNEEFTTIGLKKITRKTIKSSAPSQLVDNYIDKIPDLKMELSHNDKVLDVFNNLSFGYQKDWARYIYSTKTEATKEKRLLEMEELLLQGFKSRTYIYKAKNKN